MSANTYNNAGANLWGSGIVTVYKEARLLKVGGREKQRVYGYGKYMTNGPLGSMGRPDMESIVYSDLIPRKGRCRGLVWMKVGK
ncbi:hypothetical protein Tco_0873624 [Tanacetum coccineum]|uniref:Uncharacterized protein n=1 Tax=Tanacetum coccineum TaxID=301880 RepID=A0ABQ5BK62_9ASTR